MVRGSSVDVARTFDADPAASAEVETAVERAAREFGLDAGAAARLGQAVEEVFVHVATRASGSAFGLTLRDRHHGVEARLVCRLPSDELHWFNLTQPIDVEDAASLEALGLLLASRLVDRLSVDLDPDGGVRLVLEQLRKYPAPDDPVEPAPDRAGLPVRPEPADDAAMAMLARLFRRRLGMAVPWMFQADGLAVEIGRASCRERV